MLSALRKSRAGRAQALRRGALLLAALAVATQLSGYVHLALVEHTRCAEHGELVESGGHGPVALVATSHEAGRTPDAHLAASETAPHGHGHEHCLLSPFRRERTPFTSSLSTAPVAEDAARDHAFTAFPPRTHAVPVFRLAPKNSPPV